jgi:hypothetical protein
MPPRPTTEWAAHAREVTPMSPTIVAGLALPDILFEVEAVAVAVRP